MTRLVGLVVLVVAAATLTPARADVITYTSLMNGANESPPNGSLGTGTVFADYDNVAHTLRLHGSFSGLGTASTRAHIHVDLIVLGVPGPSKKKLGWWRSAASTVTANAPCSVHVVRVPERREGPQ